MNQVLKKIDLSHVSDSRWLIAIIYSLFGLVLVSAISQSNLSTGPLSFAEWLVVSVIILLAVMLFSVSLFELISYFVFLPSVRSDSHIFTRVHANHLIHPLTTSLVLATFTICVVSRSYTSWILWFFLLIVYLIQTVSMINQIQKEQIADSTVSSTQSLATLIAHLIFGAEIVTLAGGARVISPWNIRKLPEDTWIVDVRTKPEFEWNRLQGAENYPWGAGLLNASQSVPKDRTILVTCLSGHRSPGVAVMLRRLGFTNVYNLNWGLLYLILLERGKRGQGKFNLTRPNRTTSERGKDYKLISYGYIACAFSILILAPLENSVETAHVSIIRRMIGVTLGLSGLLLAWLAYKSLGRNFRVFAAPRRSGNLIRSGVYSKVRHPMYTAVIMGFAGYVLYWGAVWSAAIWLALTALYVVKAIKEEEVLAQRYPDYNDYKSATKRFIPYIF